MTNTYIVTADSPSTPYMQASTLDSTSLLLPVFPVRWYFVVTSASHRLVNTVSLLVCNLSCATANTAIQRLDV